jgi:hypothetical protein
MAMKPKIEYLDYNLERTDANRKAWMKRLQDADDTVQPALVAFEEKVWFAGLGEMNRTSTNRGHTAKRGPYEIRMYTMAGRVMLTIERNDGHWFSILAIEDATSPKNTYRPGEMADGSKNPRMGLGSHSMDPAEIAQVLIDLTANPPKFKASKKVHLG